MTSPTMSTLPLSWQQRRRTNRLRRTLPSLLLLILLVFENLTHCHSLHFFLDARSKRCFREDVPFGLKTVFSYTVAQGSGAMPVNIQVTDGLGRKIDERTNADHGVVTFDASSGSKLDEELYRLYPDALGDNRVPYKFCFEHDTANSHHSLFHRGRDRDVKRRVIFSVAYGVQSRNKQFYDQLAKEKHLSNTEELFRVIEDRVTDIVRLVDEMRQRESRMSFVTATTSTTVSIYSCMACLFISLGAFYTSYLTMRTLNKDKSKRRVR